MYKKIIIAVGILLLGNSCFALNNVPEDFLLIKGFKNLESIQKLNVINKLSSIADNDDVVFSKIWPRDYFVSKDNLSYIFITNNQLNDMELVKFDYPVTSGECFTENNPDFCVPKFQPKLERYIYGQRFMTEIYPNFILNPKQKEVSEILVKDSKYFDTLNVKKLENNTDNNVYKDNVFEHGFLTKSRTYDKDTDELISTEEILLREPLVEGDKNILDKAIKYVKYDAEGNKIEEYIYSNNKHSFFDEEGNLIGFEQFNNTSLKYMNTKAPEIYIDVDFKFDENGKLIEELHYDENHKLMRKYIAKYEDDELSLIKVQDVFNFKNWEIEPIREIQLKNYGFSIRY